MEGNGVAPHNETDGIFMMSTFERSDYIDLIRSGFSIIRKVSIQRLQPDGTPFVWAHTPKQKIDWDMLYRKAMEDVRPIPDLGLIDVYGALDRTLLRLNDGHSHLQNPLTYFRSNFRDVDRCPWEESRKEIAECRRKAERGIIRNKFEERKKNPPLPTVSFENDNIAYVNVPEAVHPLVSPVGHKYANDLRSAFLEIANRKEAVHGIVVDLRENQGGCLYPMLHGLSPLLGSGILGYFRGPDPREDSPWTINAPGSGLKKIRNKPENFPFLNTPVAILAGPHTCSSGEAVFLSFRGRANTQSFGEATNGRSSGNMSFPVEKSDLRIMHICTSISQDRYSKGNGGSLSVDEPTAAPLRSAIHWLKGFSIKPK